MNKHQKRQSYIYAYCDPRKPINKLYVQFNFQFQPIYIGQGQKNRIYRHLKGIKGDKNFIKINKINAIKNSGKQPIIIKIKQNLTKKQAFELQKIYISSIGTIYELPNIISGTLTNMTSGGQGGDTFSGRTLSKQHRQKISQSNKGHKHSNESKEKISKSKKGTKISKEHIQKLREGYKCMSIQSMDKMRNNTKNKIWIKNDNKNLRINKYELQIYLKEGWKQGFNDFTGKRKLISYIDESILSMLKNQFKNRYKIETDFELKDYHKPKNSYQEFSCKFCRYVYYENKKHKYIKKNDMDHVKSCGENLTKEEDLVFDDTKQ